MTDRRKFLKTVGAIGGAAVGQSRLAANPTASSLPVEGEQNEGPNRSSLRIALMQATAAGSDQHANLAKAEQYCRRAAERDADIVLMPEMWNIGYLGFDKFDRDVANRWQDQATAVDGKWIDRFRRLARELDLAIAVTYLQSWQPQPRNSVSLIDRHGDVVLTYGKVHTCDFAFEAALTAGDGWAVADLDTARGNVRIGAMICFDREFPESARSLMVKGAEVVLTPNACLLDSLRISQFQVRAFENAMAMAMTNYPAPFNNGQSVAFDGDGSLLVQAGKQEGLFIADINLDQLRQYRKQTLWGNAWRKPQQYSSLTAQTDLDEFKRFNAFGQPFAPSQQ